MGTLVKAEGALRVGDLYTKVHEHLNQSYELTKSVSDTRG
jgi:NAD+--asparagine ADP-ribosyltransferase